MFERPSHCALFARFALVLLTASLSARAQSGTPGADAQKPDATTTLRVTARLIVLDVVVLDKAGKPVTNLDRSQFSVTEDKAPQTIRNFDPPSAHAMPGAGTNHPLVNSTADLAKIGNAPVNVLVLDELNLPFEHMAYARQQMEQYLKKQPEVLPVPTQIIAAGDTKFVVLHDYTQSRAELLDAVHKHFPQYPWQMMRTGKSGDGMVERMSLTLGVLSQIAEASRGTPGRKNVIWVGGSYPSIDVTLFTGSDLDKMQALIRRVTARMLASRMTLYTVDPSGLGTTQLNSVAGNDAESGVVGNPFDSKFDFDTIATATGGQVFSGRNDVGVQIGEGVTDGGVYYTLTYAPTNASEDPQKYRHIVVRLKDPSLHVVTRDGYFAAPEAVDAPPPNTKKPSAQLKFDIASAAKTKLVYNGLKVEAKKVKNGYLLVVDADGLQWNEQPDATKRSEVTVMAVFYNVKDKEISQHAAELQDELGKDDKIVAGTRVGFSLPLALPFGTDRIRFVVRDAATGVLGSADAKP